ncbi:MAG: tetratricopeptide repeat protein [bacterium]
MPWLIIIGSILCGGGLIGIVFLVVKKIPTLAKLSEMPQPASESKFFENFIIWLKEIKYSTYPPLILNWLEKNLRKFHLLILKMDNFFVKWIKSSRERSEVWTIRSRAFLEHRRIKKREKAQLLEKLDRVEVSETMEKITQEVARDEDEALTEKIESVTEKKETPIITESLIKTIAADVTELPVEATALEQSQTEEATTEEAPTEDEKRYIDLIAKNHKDIDAYRSLGFIYLEQKNYSNARACFRRVLKKRPEDEAVKNKLEEIKGLRSARKQSEGELTE